MLKFEYRHLYIFIGGYTMEQATLHIDMIKLIERFEPIAVIWQNCRVVKLSFKHNEKAGRKTCLFRWLPTLISNQQYMITIHLLTANELSEVGSWRLKKGLSILF